MNESFSDKEMISLESKSLKNSIWDWYKKILYKKEEDAEKYYKLVAFTNMAMCFRIFKEIIEQMNKVINFINLTYNSVCVSGKGANKIFGKKSPETSKAAWAVPHWFSEQLLRK